MTDEVVALDDIRDCLRAGLPAPFATCSAEGVPDVGYVSLLQYLDAERVATSRQFFNLTPARVAAGPFAQALVVEPVTAHEYRLDLQFLHTATDGEAFDAMRANIDAIASQTGMGSVFRLRGIDVHRVLRCTRVHSRSPVAAPAADLLEPLEQLARRLERCTGYEEAAHEVLDALDDLFGFGHSILLALDPPSQRLFAVASQGYPRSAVGAEVAVGTGLIGTAAGRGRLVVQANLVRSRAMADALTGEGEPEGVHEVQLPGLPGTRSAAAVPLIAGGEVLGVLYLESERPSAFGGSVERLLRVVGMLTAATLATSGAPTVEEPGAPAPSLAATSAGPMLQLVYYEADDTVLCDSAYVVKGAPGRILWSMLEAHAGTGRTAFSNRELRLDRTLGLPAGNDNLEARLLVLRRRLADLDCGIVLERVGRGRLELTLERPAALTVVAVDGIGIS